MNVFGRGHFTPEQQSRWERAHSPTAQQRPIGKRFVAFGREILGDPRYAFILVPAALIALFTIRWRPVGLIAAGTLVALTIFWIGFTHLQSRFFILAVPLGVLLLAQPPRDSRAWLIQTSLAVILLLTSSMMTHILLIKELDRDPDFCRIIGHQDLSDFLRRQVQYKVQDRSNIAVIGDSKAFFTRCPARVCITGPFLM